MSVRVRPAAGQQALLLMEVCAEPAAGAAATDLVMAVSEDDLTVDDRAWYNKAEREYKEVMKRLEELMEAGGEVMERTDNIVVVNPAGVSNAQPAPPAQQLSPAGAPQPKGPPPPPLLQQQPPPPPPLALPKALAVNHSGAPVPGPGSKPASVTTLQVPASQAPALIQSLHQSGSVIVQSSGPVGPGLMARPTAPPGTYQLVMDPRLGILVGAVPAAGPHSGAKVRPAAPNSRPVSSVAGTATVQSITGTKTATSVQSIQNHVRGPMTVSAVRSGMSGGRTITVTKTTVPVSNSQATTSGVQVVGAAPGTPAVTTFSPRGRAPNRVLIPPAAGRSNATETPAVPSSNAPVVDLTDDPGDAGRATSTRPPPLAVLTTKPGAPKPLRPVAPARPLLPRAAGPANAQPAPASASPPLPSNAAIGSASSHIPADSREVNFSKVQGKTYPSLVVLAKPSLRLKDFPQAQVTAERSELDQRVKSVLLYSTTKFTEWLIQQGLVRSEQICQQHATTAGTPVRLKLGMYSDVSKFPYSGGYVWISECCPQLFVSVFSGSIFEGAPHPPMVLLKLLYHWCCQTNSTNIVQWVKVDNLYIKNFFTNMRAVCTAAIHDKFEKIGGPAKRVEVGVISLGTTAQDGSARNVKVEVLGVMDPETKLVRLRAVDPLQHASMLQQMELDKNYKRRFSKILEPLEGWVHKKSIILTDFTVDKATLYSMGFQTVYQVSVNPEGQPQASRKYSNINVMNYLRKVVPKMFQNTLSLLSRQIIQQFLDELVWRERWGPVAPQAFNNAVLHIAEQTRNTNRGSLLQRLNKISANPFADWRFSGREDVAGSAADTSVSGAASQAHPAQPASNADALRPSIDMLPESIRTAAPSAPAAAQARRAVNWRKRVAGDPGNGAPDPKRAANSSVAAVSRKSNALTPASVVPVPYSTMVVGADQTTSLHSYYYGSLEGDLGLIGSEAKYTQSLKCCACQRSVANNIQLMKHLILHAHADNQFSSELSDITQCKYCLKSFSTPFSMQTHLEEVHLTNSTGSRVCRICTEKFREGANLIQHMHRTHVALEMPYVCRVCQYRSSLHRDLIDHFYEVHVNGEKLLCPFCLKTVAFASNGRRLFTYIGHFLVHLQKHQRRSVARKCSRCALSFVNKLAMREHLQRDHVSFKDVAGVKAMEPQPGEDLMMPLPPADLSPAASLPAYRRSTAAFASHNRQSTTFLFSSTLRLSQVPDGFRCYECKEEMSDAHYPGYMMCSRCRYSTCCPKAMKEHMRIFHESPGGKPVFLMGQLSILPKSMFCVCGYQACSGNRLAKHLAMCDRKSAYPSLARAQAATVQSASFPPLVMLDDAETASEDPSDRWLKAFMPARREDGENGKEAVPEKKAPAPSGGGDPPSMLNVLGLVRKPSTDDSSLDKAPSDKEDKDDCVEIAA